MSKTITFNNGEKEIVLKVQNIFSYTYDALKTVLKVTINEKDHSYAELAELKNCKSDIIYKEDGEIKSEYTGYTLGADAYSCNYKKGVFEVEVERAGAGDLRMDVLEKLIRLSEVNISDLEAAFMEMSEIVYQ